MFIKIGGLSRILSFFPYSPLSSRNPQSSSLFFRPDKDAKSCARSMVQFLRRPAMHLIHAGKQMLNPGYQSSCNTMRGTLCRIVARSTCQLV